MVCLVGRRTYESIILDTHQILKSNPGIIDLNEGNWADGGREFRYKNGSKIYFRHLENADHALGPTYGLIFIDQAELIKEEDFRKLGTRLRQFEGEGSYATETYMNNYSEAIKNNQLLAPHNYFFLSANPKPNWIKSRFIDKTETGFTNIALSTYDNAINLPKDYINPNESDDFKSRYYDGKWEFLSGLIYPEFTDEHIVDTGFELNKALNWSKLKTYIVADIGFANSKTAILYATVLVDGTIYIFDEIVKNGRDVEEGDKILIPEIAELIKEKNKAYNIQPQGIIDFAANARIGGNTSITQQFQQLGVIFNNCVKDNEYATIMKIKGMLKAKKIIVNARCSGTIKEFGLFQWADKGTIEKPRDADNDCMDALRYLINSFPRHSLAPAVTGFTQQTMRAGWYSEMFKSDSINQPISDKSLIGWGHDDKGFGI
jgi:phage terminase large subunit